MNDGSFESGTVLLDPARPSVNLVVRPARPKPEPRERDKEQPPYAVVLHNDNVNGFDFVVRSVRGVFGYSAFKAFRITMRAHRSGRSTAWTGMLEHAELKAEQLTACGPDPRMVDRGATPLGVTVEPIEE